MEKFLKLAKEDLETAQLLYKGKKYSNALYHYHQSVEKVSKYIGLSIVGISEAQLKDISHDPIKAFKFLFKYFVKQSNGLLPTVNPHLFTNAKQIISLESEVDIVKNAMDMLKLIGNEGKIINEELFSSPFDAVIDYTHKRISNLNLALDDDLFKQYATISLQNQSINTIIFINFGIKMLQILFINSLICSKFTPDQFRYPSNKLGNPVEYFNENNALIRDLQFFINSMNIPIEMASKINWKLNHILII